MKKALVTLSIIGAAAAALVLGQEAQAVSDSLVFSASANNPATLSISSSDTDLDCGDIVAGACSGVDTASLSITSNSAWALTVEDSVSEAADTVMLTSAKDGTTTFNMGVVASAVSGLGDGSVTFSPGALVGYNAATTRDGAYTGSFLVTVATE